MKQLFLIIGFLGLSLLATVDAQTSVNPFDIQVPPTAEQRLKEAIPVTGNPFDIRIPPVDMVEEPRVIGPGTRPVEELDEDEKASGRFRFVLVLSILLLLTVGVSLFRSIIQKAYRSFLNDNFLNQVYREQANLVSWPYMVLYLIFFFQLGIFIYLSVLEFGWLPDKDHWQGLWQVVGGVSVLLILKHFFLILIGSIYPVNKTLGQYSFSMVVFGIIGALALIPLNLLLSYGPESLRIWLVFIGIALLVILYLYRSLRGMLSASSLLSGYFFHFLLYICTIEIAPAVWLYKILSSQIA